MPFCAALAAGHLNTVACELYLVSVFLGILLATAVYLTLSLASHLVRRKDVLIMKKIGIVRAIDKLGRIVIPMEMRVLLDMAEIGTEVEISQEGQRIVIEKHRKSCRFCDSTEELLDFKGKKVCRACISELNGAF